jgi:formylglycine-generating enzyme required for sulfatase activity
MAPLTLEEYKAQLMPIPGGSFKREGFTVTLSAFQMGRTPVTVGMWQEYAAAKDLEMPELPDYPVWNDGWNSVRDHPIVNVSWEDCKAYADWAELLLPTEAQWEFAASGGDDRVYPWGDDWNKSKCHCSTEKSGDAGGTASVGSYPAGPFGLSDVVGNVWDWCSDWYGDWYDYPYPTSNETDPVGTFSGKYRVLRGGAWSYYNAGTFRCSYRFANTPSGRFNNNGFRLSSPAPR